MSENEDAASYVYVSALPIVPIWPHRRYVIVDRCANKSVLHLGCVDSGLLEHKHRQGSLLHDQVSKVAKELWGVDQDMEGLDWLRAKGFGNLHYGNAESLGAITALDGQRFDVVVAAEILEHLDNPGLFLESARPYLALGGELVITTPNAFRGDQPAHLIENRELVHPEHVCWYSYQTLLNLLTRHSYDIAYSALSGVTSLSNRSPYFATGLIFIVQARQAA